MEKEFLEAAKDFRLHRVAELLQGRRDLDVNWVEPNHPRPPLALNALQYACFYGHVKLVRLLLSYPRIDVNRKTSSGQTPLRLACFDGRTEVLRMLLRDPRLDICQADELGRTAVWMSAWCGYDRVLEVLVASGRDLRTALEMKGRVIGYQDMEDPVGAERGVEKTPLGAARMRGNTRVALLLEEYTREPEKTRREVRSRLASQVGQRETIAEMFATIVLLCDEFFALRGEGQEGSAWPEEPENTTAARSFLRVAVGLPMELQMVLCHRACGSGGILVSRTDSELAFRLVLFEDDFLKKTN